MKKRLFLAPLAVAMAALLGTAKADAKAVAPEKSPEGMNKGEKFGLAPFVLPEILVLRRSPETGEMMAYHSSHQSHSSHYSHRSHYSSRY